MNSNQALKTKSSTATKLSISREPKNTSSAAFGSKTKIAAKSNVKLTSKNNVAETSTDKVKSKGLKKRNPSEKGKKTIVHPPTSKLSDEKERLVKSHIERIRAKIGEAEKKYAGVEVKKVKKGKRPASVPNSSKAKLSVAKVKRTSVSVLPKVNQASKSVARTNKVSQIKLEERPTTVLSKVDVGKKVVSSSKDMQSVKKLKSKSLTKLGTPSKQAQRVQANRPASSKKRPITTQSKTPLKVKSEVVTKVQEKAKPKGALSSLKTITPKKLKIISKEKDPENLGVGEFKFSPGNLSVTLKLKQSDTIKENKSFGFGIGSQVEEKLMKDIKFPTKLTQQIGVPVEKNSDITKMVAFQV